MTSKQSLDSEPDAFGRPEFTHRLSHVCGTRRIKPASLGKQRGKHPLVDTDQGNDQPAHGAFCTTSLANASRKSFSSFSNDAPTADFLTLLTMSRPGRVPGRLVRKISRNRRFQRLRFTALPILRETVR